MAEREPYFCTITDSSCSVGLKATWGLGNQFYVFPGKKPTLLHGGHHTTGKEEIIREVRWDTDLHQPVFRKLVNEAHNIFLCLQQQAKETTGAALHPHIVKSSKRYRASLKAYSLELKYLAGVIMPKRKGKQTKNECVKSKKPRTSYLQGQPVLCPLSPGIFWPGYVADIYNLDEISVGFFGEESRNTMSVSKLIPFEESNELISASLKKLTKVKSKWLNKYKLDLKEASSLMTATTDKDMELDSINMDNSENIKKRARNKVKNRDSQDVTEAEHWENENSSNDDPDFVPSGEKAAPNETLCNLEKREDIESQSKAEHWENENSSNDDPDFVPSGEKAAPNETLCNLEKREDIESQSKAEHWENENSSNDDPDFVPSGEKAAPNETLCNLEKREDIESQSKAEHWENENSSNVDPDFVPSGEKAAPNETLCNLEKREDIESQSKAEHWENENSSNDDPDFVLSGEKAAPNETLCNLEKREDIESQSKAEHWENENSSNDDPDFVLSGEKAAPNETLCNVEKREDIESQSKAEHWENENDSNDDPDFILSGEKAAPNETLCNLEKREDIESQSKAEHWENENDSNDDPDFILSGEKAAPNETLCNLEKREDIESQSKAEHWENENSSNVDPDFVLSGEKAAPNETLCNLEKREDIESQSKAEHWENENSSNDDPDFVLSGEKAAPNETLCNLEKREDIESQSKAEHWENENDSNDDPDFILSGEKAAPNETLCNLEKREDIESQSKAEHWENENDSNDDPDFIPSSENSEDEMSDCIPVLSHVETMDVQAAPNETLCNLEKREDSESQSEADHWENENSSNDDPDFIPSSENSEDEMSDCILSHVEIMDVQAAPNETLCNAEKRDDSESQSKADRWETENDPDDPDFIPSGEKAAPNETLCNEKREDSESQSEGQGNSVKKCIGVQPMAIQGLPAESQLKPEERLEDINYPDIFTKRYAKDANEQSVHKRTYDRRHSCYFCGKLKTNIQTHLEHAHRSCEEVKKMYELKTKIGEMEENGEKKNLLKTELHRLQTSIRNKGDNIHNSKVYASKKGEIVLGRRRESKDFDVSKYGPCPQCMEWIILENVKKHMAFCPLRCQIGEASSEAGIEDFTKGSMILQSKIMKGQITSKPSKRLLKEVFPSMSRDEISDIAQNDTLIVALGDTWLMKNIGNKSRRKNFTSFRMRLAARYLLLLRECSGKKDATLAEFIQPTHFDNAVECAFKACQETEEEELKSPSTAIKLGYDLSRLASAKLGFCIKNNDDKGKLEATDFLRLIQMEWSIKVTKYARVLLDERHFNKAKSLPIPEDIVQLATFMVEKIEATDLSEPNPELFREVVVLTEARLLLYNRRRPGELESLSVDAYLRRPSLDETELTLRQGLTAFEKHLLESQDLVEIRGKTGRGVPLLIPKEAKRMLEFLSDSSIREKGGIKRGNTLMFANTGDSAVRAGDALSEVKVRLKLKQPSRILATNLRKHTATIAQVLSLNEQQMKYVCNHLGHTQKIHDQYYRQTSGLIERIDIAKIMLIQEHNLVSTYANKKLEEVQFEDIIDDIAEIPKNNANEETLESSEERLEGNEDFMQVDVDMADFLDEPGRKKRKDSTIDQNQKQLFLDHLQLLEMSELIWSLCEILFIDSPAGGLMITQLLDWLRLHFQTGEQLFMEILKEERPEDSPYYWDTVYRLVLQGQVDRVRRLLSVHSARHTDCFVSIDDILKKMPMHTQLYRGHSAAEFDMKWRHWRDECERRLEEQEFSSYGHLEVVAKILCGNDLVFSDLKDLCETWYHMLISKMLYQNPTVKAFDLQYYVQGCIDEYRSSMRMGELDNILLSALESDIHQVIKDSSAMFSNWWFVAHLTDLLQHCGLLESHKLQFGSNLREFLLLEYATSLMSHKSLWIVGVSYLDNCPEFGRKYLENFIENLPLETERKAHKLLHICQERNMIDQAKSICKVMGMRHMQNKRLGSALTWFLKSKDVAFATIIAEQFLFEYGRKGCFSNLDLIDNLGPSMLVSNRLTFLGKYREFHKLYEEKELQAAGDLLLSLLQAKLAPKQFWITLLEDAIPLLQADQPVFSTTQTYDLMQCLEELVREFKDLSVAEKEKLELLRLSLSRNLSKAIVMEGTFRLHVT